MDMMQLLQQYMQEQQNRKSNESARNQAIMQGQAQRTQADQQMAMQSQMARAMKDSGGIPSGESNLPQSEQAKMAYRLAQLQGLNAPSNTGSPAAGRSLDAEQLALQDLMSPGSMIAQQAAIARQAQQSQGPSITQESGRVNLGLEDATKRQEWLDKQRSDRMMNMQEKSMKEKALTQEKMHALLRNLFSNPNLIKQFFPGM